MKRVIICITLILLFISNISQACWTDTGWITYTQPNGVKFTARMWGDEYESFFETKEGFSIEKNNSDGFYYYANSSYKGVFVLTKLKVGVDKPVGIPKNLVKKNPFAVKPQKLTGEVNVAANNRLSKVTVTNYTLKVLLVEFQDVHGDINGKTYTRTNFKNMLDGSNYTSSPDGEATFGSMNQYYNSMTNSNVTITATVLNNSGGGDIPNAVRLRLLARRLIMIFMID